MVENINKVKMKMLAEREIPGIDKNPKREKKGGTKPRVSLN